MCARFENKFTLSEIEQRFGPHIQDTVNKGGLAAFN